jgi:lipid A ethanolaminephosphotransferase
MDYASFFRNHKEIRQMANPLNFIYAGLSYATTNDRIIEVKPIENDAAISASGKAIEKPTLFILVVGETARADHFGINGYERNTTPLIAQQNIINFPQVISCGTETAVSVPCMFSNLGRSGYSDSKAKSQEGLLDVISHAGISVLWRDNNSSCKGACNRVNYEEMQHLQVPELCTGRECFDEILLHQLDEQVASAAGSKVIVLHQKGSHGPDYFKRYPQSNEFYAPVCKSNQLQNCTKAEVVNAYDNTIRYTDYFLNKTIEWLKSKGDYYNTSLIYLSDHGESLGENNLYLHGMPYSIAPKEQKQVPFFMWLSAGYSAANHIDSDCMRDLSVNPYSHDNLFHTVLGMLNLQTHVYDATS